MKKKISIWQIIIGGWIGLASQYNLAHRHGFGSAAEAQAFTVTSFIILLIGIYLLISDLTGFRLVKKRSDGK
jgi:hypothetical protein